MENDKEFLTMLSDVDKEFLTMLSGVAKSMGFGDVDFVSMAEKTPKGMEYKHLDIVYSDGSSERIYIEQNETGE